ncbi:hypothetical protein AB8810_13100 [Xanthomonas sp. NCPPB 3005]|uniref:hypothetical protein n=1 Tax=Xanthomonas sp. NCPPB 3005 TaxID=3240913 RepID=UPI00351220EF
MKWQLSVACTVVGLGILLGDSTSVQAAQVGDAAAEDVAAQLGSHYAEQQKIIRKNALVHSQVGLFEYLKKSKGGDSPLDSLSPSARARFIESLKLNEGGVTSFYYADIEAELNSSQAYALLSLFGLQSTLRFMPKLRVDNDSDREIMRAFGSGTPGIPLPEDHNDYWCSGRATCSRNVGSICTGNC